MDNPYLESKAPSSTAWDLMWENGGPGVWAPDYMDQYDLKDAECRFDAVPQIMDGMNITNYVDTDIDLKLVVGCQVLT